MKEQVVITGIGMLNALGDNVEDVWKNVLLKKRVARKLKNYDTSRFPAIHKNAYGYEYDITNRIIDTCKNNYIDPSKLSRYPLSSLYTAITAMEDSGIDTKENSNGCVLMSSVIGDSLERFDRVENILDGTTPYSRRKLLTSELGYPGGLIMGHFGLTGLNMNTQTACASTIQSIDYAMKLLLYDELDYALVIATEIATEPFLLHTFEIGGAATPDKTPFGCKPLDKNRSGMMTGDGSICLVLEKESLAVKRDAHMYGVINGIGFASDDYHVSSPSENGAGIRRSLDMLYRKIDLKPEDADFVNCHATGTIIGDIREFNTLNDYFPGKLANAYKANTGHLFSAAGGTELALCLLSMRDNIVSGCLNVTDPLDGDLIVNIENTYIQIDNFVKCAFGFGGKCTAISVSKI